MKEQRRAQKEAVRETGEGGGGGGGGWWGWATGWVGGGGEKEEIVHMPTGEWIFIRVCSSS